MILEIQLQEKKTKQAMAKKMTPFELEEELKHSSTAMHIKIINIMKTIISNYYALDPKQVFFSMSKKRTREFVTARQVYCYMMCKNTKLPIVTIGRSIRQHHATIIHSKRKVEDLMVFDKKLVKDVQNIQSIYECTEGSNEFVNEFVPYFINMRAFHSARVDNKRAVLMTGLTEEEMNAICQIIGVKPEDKREHTDNPFYIL
jgi:hypothetical protein